MVLGEERALQVGSGDLETGFGRPGPCAYRTAGHRYQSSTGTVLGAARK
jgi:hypothetical protein